MYKPQPQDPTSTNQPPVAPVQNPIAPAGAVRVLAPEGHFPQWLQDELKGLSTFQVTTYSSISQAKEKVVGQLFDLYLIPDRAVIEGIAHQKFLPLPQGFMEPKELPIQTYLNHPLDPHNQFSLPYGCTYYGFAYHKDALPKGIKSWKDLFAGDNFAQTDFPQDSELLYILTLIAEGQVGKTDKKLDFKTPSSAQGEEFPLRVRTLSELRKLSPQNPAWQVVTPEDGSAIELYHIALGALQPPLGEIVKKFLNPLIAARISEENQFSSTFKAVLNLQSQVTRKNLNPDSKWMDKAIFIRPPKAAKAHS
ncbi:MAG: hypothetical protein V4507_03715 [Verrucomicrobiota bacterium]